LCLNVCLCVCVVCMCVGDCLYVSVRVYVHACWFLCVPVYPC
jgi:hypothetical protein